MTTLTKRYAFSASHRLASPALSDDQNRRIFGKCANPHGHGHNYYLEVSVSGDADPISGLTLGRRAMDDWVRDSVLERIDHTHLNSEFPEFGDRVPTAENILLVITDWLRTNWVRHFPGHDFALASLRLEETPRNSFQI